MPARVVLVDGSSMIFRAFFAIPSSFATSGGTKTNATYGFALMFRKLFAGKAPALGAVVFDAPGETFRDREYPDYKANRAPFPSDLGPQIPYIHRVVEAYAFPVLRIPGYEADDIIGTLTKQAVLGGHEVMIVSGDKDFAQLIAPSVRMLDAMRDITYDEELVRKKWGVRPEQIVDLFALMGDSIDNIPGVPGIGQKGAAQLLEQFGTLDAILSRTDELKGRAKNALVEHRDNALLSRRLATIDCAVPLDVTVDQLAIPAPDTARIDALYKELEFFSLLTSAPEMTAVAGDHGTVGTVDDLRALLDSFGTEPVGVWLVNEGSFTAGAWVGVALGQGDRARYVPLFDGAQAVLAAWFSDASRPKVVQRVAHAYTLLRRHGIALEGVVGDPGLASFLIDPAGIIPHEIGQIARQYLQRALAPAKTITGSGQKELLFAEVDPAALAAWTCQQVAAVVEAWPLLVAALEKVGQTHVLRDVDLPLAKVLGDMQYYGIRVDVPALEQMGAEFEARKLALEQQVYKLAGHEFNIGSTKQLGTVLFEELGLPVLKKTKTGWSTDAEVLERLAKKHEIADLIVQQRALAKLINTYTDVLRASVNPATGRVHATFQQTVGVSGRLISTDPDLQRTPIRTDDGARIRHCFVADPGRLLISADWSQIELRVLAHVTGDPVLIDAFVRGVDVHRETAATLFDTTPDAVGKEQRNIGKTINFATIYGQGAVALGQQLDISKNEAKAYIDRYFAKYAEVAKWKTRTIEEAHKNGFVETLLGRRRIVRELSSNNFTDRAYGERIATNTPIQGSAADICKLAMLECARRLQHLDVRLLMQIHDELVFETVPDAREEAMGIIRDVMEHVVPLKVPLVVDIGYGRTWGEAH